MRSRTRRHRSGRRGPAVAALVACALSVPTAAVAASPARERLLACSDGTEFLGEQVRMGGGRPPHAWRAVEPGSRILFSFHAATVTAPDGTVVESATWDTSQGVARRHDLVTCSFEIPVGPFAGHQADFVGFFVPPAAR